MRLFEHRTHPHRAQNVNAVHYEQMTLGERIADTVASIMGSWKFIIIQTAIVTVWIVLNIWLLTHPYDPYPLILLNLVFSTQAAYASPLILMSQNRQAAKDRIAAEEDYNINRKGEDETRQIYQHLYAQDEKIYEVAASSAKIEEETFNQTKLIVELLQHVKGKRS